MKGKIAGVLRRAMRGREEVPVKADDETIRQGSEPWKREVADFVARHKRKRNWLHRHKRILMATSLGIYNHGRTTDGVVGAALAVRGHSVEFLLCDGVLAACQMSKTSRVDAEGLATDGQLSVCERCHPAGVDAFLPIGLPVNHYSDWLSGDERALARRVAQDVPFADIADFRWEGLPVGEHAKAGALRYFARGDFQGEQYGEPVLRRFLEGGLVTIFALRRLLKTKKFDVVVAHHGIYIPQSMIVAVAREQKVRVVTWNPAYRKNSFIFSHDDTYHHTMITEPRSTWDRMSMTQDLLERTNRYLESRRMGTNDWIWFHDTPDENAAAVLREVGADPDKPFVLALTSVVWDAQLHYKANAFSTMMDWIVSTIDYWRRREDLQLVIRIHPAEIRGAVPSRHRVADEVAKFFHKLPDNVFLVLPENQASTYALIEKSDSVIIFNTKTGVEVGAMGKPVIVAGEAWIRGKGFSIDVSSADEYCRILDKLPFKAPLDCGKHELATRYAFHFFFRRMIPLPFVHQYKPAHFSVQVTSAESLKRGMFTGLDVICDGIAEGTPFVFHAETFPDDFERNEGPRTPEAKPETAPSVPAA